MTIAYGNMVSRVASTLELAKNTDHAVLRYFLWALSCILTLQVLLFIYRSLTSPLRSVPGPFLARFGRLYFFFQVAQGRWEHVNVALHRRYGPVVRVAPDMYSIDSSDIIKQVYGIGSKYAKSDWYEAWKHPSPDRGTLFSERDLGAHADSRKRFQAMYSMSSLVHYEKSVDECAAIFTTRLAEFANRSATIDMARWFQHYAFDVIGEITYSHRFGFLDRGEDFAGLQAALHEVMRYGSLVGIFAKWHPWLYEITNRLGVGGGRGRNFLIKFVEERINQRKEEKQAGVTSGKTAEQDESAPMDFLEKLLAANEKEPEKVTMYHVWTMGLSNVIAGSDTTSVSLSSILYNLLKYPDTMRKLREEIKTCEKEGRCGNPNVTFKQSQNMPFLQAVIKEALRMHAATGLPLWRDVPKGGAELGGYSFPQGTTVGLNTWCAHYKDDVFGPDAYRFRPERWIDAEKEGGQRLKTMETFWVPVSSRSTWLPLPFC